MNNGQCVFNHREGLAETLVRDVVTCDLDALIKLFNVRRHKKAGFSTGIFEQSTQIVASRALAISSRDVEQLQRSLGVA